MSDSRANIIHKFRSRIAEGKRNKLSKRELESLIESLIARLRRAKSSEEIHEICRSEISLLEEGYKKLTLASIYIPRYRAAIKEAIASNQLQLTPKTSHTYQYQQRVTGKQETRSEHWALTYLKYTPEEYEKLDTRQAKVNRQQLLNLKTVQLDRYLDAIHELLHSQEKFAARHQAIAIAALTGRRMGEVVARGTFSLTKHPYQLHFTGQQKYERDGYDIVTLIPADYLLDKISEFRAQPEIQTFEALEETALKKQLNQFDVQVNKECDKRLRATQIVPPLEGKKSVTIHNLRSLWGAIAVYFFCPEEHHEYAFLQHYLGHVLKSSATGHYFRYQLVDTEGQILKNKGVKLEGVPVLPLLEDRRHSILNEQASTLDSTLTELKISAFIIQLDKSLLKFQQICRHRFKEIEKRLTAVELSKSSSANFKYLKKIYNIESDNSKLKTQNSKLLEEKVQVEDKLEQFRKILLEEEFLLENS